MANPTRAMAQSTRTMATRSTRAINKGHGQPNKGHGTINKDHGQRDQQGRSTRAMANPTRAMAQSTRTMANTINMGDQPGPWPTRSTRAIDKGHGQPNKRAALHQSQLHAQAGRVQQEPCTPPSVAKGSIHQLAPLSGCQTKTPSPPKAVEPSRRLVQVTRI